MKKILTLFSILLISSCAGNGSYTSLEGSFGVKKIDLQVMVNNDSIGGKPQIDDFLSREEISEIIQKSLQKKLGNINNSAKEQVEIKMSFDYHRQ